MAKETKRDRFVRVAEQRTQKVLDDLKALSKCANPAVYELTNDDVDKIFAAINAAVADARASLKGEKRFTLSTAPKEVTRQNEDTVTRYMIPEDRWATNGYEDLDEAPNQRPLPEKMLGRDGTLCLSELDLSVNAYSALWRGGVETVGDLIKLSEADLGKFKTIGRKAKDEIKSKLAGLGLELRREEPLVEGSTSSTSLDERIKSAESKKVKPDLRVSEKDVYEK